MRIAAAMLRFISTVFIFTAIFSLLVHAQSAGTAGTIRGKVADSQGAVIPGATVTILNPVTGYTRTQTTDSTGQFEFSSVPQNPYHMSTQAQGFSLGQQDVDVRSAVPIVVAISLKPGGSQSVVNVTAEAADLLEQDPSAHTDVDANQVAHLPLENASSGLSEIIMNATPGVVRDSNGFFHPLGDHAQASFSIDNQTISDQQSRVYSNQPNFSAFQSIEVISGLPQAEYGDKTSLVTVATTKSGLGLKRATGSVNVGYSSFGTGTTTLNLGLGDSRVGNFISLDGLNTGRFLDTPEFQTLHDKGNSESFFDRFDWQPHTEDSFHVDLFAAHSWFQAPNTFDQAAAGQDQRQKLLTYNFAPSYTHLFNENALLTMNLYVRQDQLRYYPSADLFSDQPETVGQTRRLTNSGFRADVSYVKGHHNFKAGMQISHTALSENFRFGITDPTNNPVCLDSSGNPVLDPTITDPNNCAAAGFDPNPGVAVGLIPFDLTRGGTLFAFKDSGKIDQQALYAQDAFTLGQLTASAGLRFDHYAGLTHKSLAEPRIGLSYNVRRTNTVLRAGYARTLETPYNENLLLSNATGAGGLAGNVFGATTAEPLRPGTRNQYNLGFQQAFGRYLVVDGEYFWKHTRNGYDFNTLGDTPIAFPIAWNKSKIDGFSLRVSIPEFHGIRAFTVMGHTNARFFNPEVGGLFFDTNPPTGVFRIDHDQAFEQTTNVQYTFSRKRGGWTAFTWRYDSGLVAGAVPDFATALTLTPDQQAAIGLFCGSTVATLNSPITSCSDPHHGAQLLDIPADGTENDDHNPPRVHPRHLFDTGIGFDNLFAGDRVHWNAKFTVVNLTNQVALYNFLSTFSGTHFVTPRSYQAELGFSF